MFSGRTAYRAPLLPGIASFVACGLLTALPAYALPGAAPARRQAPDQDGRAAREMDRLFGDEMRLAVTKLKWHGEKLTGDTVYAVALTGASWETAWGKDPLFSLAWGDLRKAQSHRSGRNRETAAQEVRALYQSRDYRRTVDYALANFTLDEIGCDEMLKEPVGASLMALGQPEQAYPVYSAPYDSGNRKPENDARFRAGALEAARRAGLKKEAIAFSLSLLLQPDHEGAEPDRQQLEYLESSGVDVDRVLLGILQSPERLRGLPAYYYAAADLMAYRASPRTFSFLMQLSDSADAYLRGRALIGLCLAAYQAQSADPAGWSGRLILSAPREFGISTGERRLVDRKIREGAGSDKYRIRASAAVAMGLSGDPDYVPLLQKMAKDRAYVLLAEDGGKTRNLVYPVRSAASAALFRYGVSSPTGGGSFSGRELDRARRGGSDETNEHRGLRHDQAGTIRITPVDDGLAPPAGK